MRQLRYFAAVARRAHFTQAARDIGIAQPAISQQIAQLERELRVTLLDRTSRSVRLTDAGKAFLKRAERILADVAVAEAEMHEYAGLLRGRIVVGSLQLLSELMLPKLLRRFHARYPQIEIALREDVTDLMLAGLREGELDVALVHLTDPAPGADLEVEPLFDDELALAVAPHHRLAASAHARLSDVRDEPFISFRPGSGLNATLHAA